MKKIYTLLLLGLTLALAPQNAAAANTNYQRSTTVNDTITVTADQNVILRHATPFGEKGMVDLVNTDHAVLILSKVRPTDAIRLLSAHVRINGKMANPDRNCQVKMYNHGSIIMPYAPDFSPLTVYSEQNFEGEAVTGFKPGHTGGYMNTLTTKQLNNRIRSFKLKRGYMVTFSTRPAGRGYSRCFIAADADLEMKVLPDILDQKISSYRVFQWLDAGKPQLANDLTESTITALNAQSSYTWSQGHDMLPNIECVANHIYEDYPTSSACGSATWTCHMKNNNEPRNSADDHPQDLKTILNNWENIMATGMRLCSPASWDGSDYWNATGFLADFLDSIDARGWRCDIIDLHCYWPEGNFGNINNWASKYKRPVWISEWCWGASWNNNGAFASGVTENQVRDALQRICTKLNGWDYVERYYYWNGERDPSRLYKNGKLTPAGTMYAALDAGLGYNGKYDKVPTTPRQLAPGRIEVTVDPQTGHALVQWQDNNGEYSRSVQVERSTDGGISWQVAGDAKVADGPSMCSFVDTLSQIGCKYRVHQVDINKKSTYTKTATYSPQVYTRPVEAAGSWGTICLKTSALPMQGTQLYEVVGVTPDLSALCVQPMDHVEGGYPAVFRTDSLQASFLQYGQEVKAEKLGSCGLVGQFEAYPLDGGCIYLKDGQWWVVPEGQELPLGAFEACFSDATDLVVLTNWTGLTMPVHGLPQGTGISTLTVGTTAAGWYTLDGRRVLAPARGIYIKVEDGHVRKVVNR